MLNDWQAPGSINLGVLERIKRAGGVVITCRFPYGARGLKASLIPLGTWGKAGNLARSHPFGKVSETRG